MPLEAEGLRFLRVVDRERIRAGEYEKEGASGLLTNAADQVLLQLRDDIPMIRYPGHWSLPGGLLEPGETPEDAFRREMLEELSWAAGAVEPFGMILDAYGNLVNYFTARLDVPPDALTLGKGREIRFFGPDDVTGLSIPPHATEVLAHFFAHPGQRFGTTRMP